MSERDEVVETVRAALIRSGATLTARAAEDSAEAVVDALIEAGHLECEPILQFAAKVLVEIADHPRYPSDSWPRLLYNSSDVEVCYTAAMRRAGPNDGTLTAARDTLIRHIRSREVSGCRE